jgi:hypothetical protein
MEALAQQENVVPADYAVVEVAETWNLADTLSRNTNLSGASLWVFKRAHRLRPPREGGFSVALMAPRCPAETS